MSNITITQADMDASVEMALQELARKVRVEKLRQMLAARTGPDGNAQHGFAENVAALREAIAKHEARLS